MKEQKDGKWLKRAKACLLENQPIISAVAPLVSLIAVVIVAWLSGHWALNNAQQLAREDLRRKSYSRLYGQKQEYQQALKSYFDDIIENRYNMYLNFLNKSTTLQNVPIEGERLFNSQKEQLEIFAELNLVYNSDTSITNCISRITKVKQYNVSNPFSLKIHNSEELEDWRRKQYKQADSAVVIYDSLFINLLETINVKMGIEK